MTNAIRVVALCVFRRADSILVFEGFDSVLGMPFYRPLGGGVNAGETTHQAIIREIREEIEAEITKLALLGTLENIFMLEGKLCHEIVFVYEGQFVDETLNQREEFTIHEDNAQSVLASWRPLSFFTTYHRLVPDGLKELLDSKDPKSSNHDTMRKSSGALHNKCES
jgi:8-oxo-dGTP pyrophosphatase MutT (NUDIX family)